MNPERMVRRRKLGGYEYYVQGGDKAAVLERRPTARCQRLRLNPHSPHRIYTYEVVWQARSIGSGDSAAAAWEAARSNMLAEALTS